MNMTEAAAYLTSKGYRCSPHTVRVLCREKKLSHYRVGLGQSGRIEVPESEADRFLKAALIGGAPEPAAAPKIAARPQSPSRAPARMATRCNAGDWKARLDELRRR